MHNDISYTIHAASVDGSSAEDLCIVPGPTPCILTRCTGRRQIAARIYMRFGDTVHFTVKNRRQVVIDSDCQAGDDGCPGSDLGSFGDVVAAGTDVKLPASPSGRNGGVPSPTIASLGFGIE